MAIQTNPVNFGILQSAPVDQSRPVTMTSVPDQGAAFAGAFASTADAATNAVNSYENNSRENQLMPGKLQNQVLVNQGQGISNAGGILDNKGKGLQNQSAAMTVANQQREVQKNQAVAAAYKGAPKGQQAQAMADAAFKYGDTDLGTKILTNEQDVRVKIQAGNTNDVAAEANNLYQIQAQAKPPIPPVKLPNGQMSAGHPGISSLQVYTAQYPELSKLHPDLPAPNTFKNDADFENGFLTPRLNAALPVFNQKMAETAALKDNKTYQAQVIRNQAQDRLTQAIQNGASPAEIAQAKDDLNNANNNLYNDSNNIAPQGMMSRALLGTGAPKAGGGIGGAISSYLGTNDNNAPAPAQAAPQAPAAAPQASPVQGQVQLPPGFDPQAAQAELARRMTQQGANQAVQQQGGTVQQQMVAPPAGQIQR